MALQWRPAINKMPIADEHWMAIGHRTPARAISTTAFIQNYYEGTG